MKRSLNLLSCLLLMAASASGEDDTYAKLRQRMVEAIRADVIWTSQAILKTRLDARVMEVMGIVPRHELVPPQLRHRAYQNRPLPIGYGQTISQPYIVALMTDLVEPDPQDVVLEVGTGSGYQAAVLSRLVAQVYSIEIIPELGERAAGDLKRLGYANVEVRVGDGYYGWEEHAPFDAVVVTAAASHVPPALIEQLKPQGRMVIPVGSPFMTQQLMLVEKSEAGKVKTRQVLPVSFVPLTGKHD